MVIYLSALVNALLIIAFIIDRLYRLHSIKEYREAKEAQIANLKQQLETAKENNDVQIAELHKKRYENVKMILDEREAEITGMKDTLLSLQIDLQTASKDAEMKHKLNEKLLEALNKTELSKHQLEVQQKDLENRLKVIYNLPGLPPPNYLG